MDSAASSELRRLTTRAHKDKVQWFDNDDSSNNTSGEEDNHEDLLRKIKSLDKKEILKRYKGQLRTEPNKNVSEFYLKSEGDGSHVNLGDLVGSLQTSSYNSKLKKTLERLQNVGRTVEVPLTKKTAEHIQRVVAYEETSKDISKWEPTVQKNRRAEQLSFPLDPYKPAEMTATTLATTFKPRTPLEQEIASVLQNSSQMLEREDKELSLEEEEALKNMSLEEALERRHELQKLRALQSYYEQKCRRMKKIKSKKYHRIKRRAEKRANSKQSFEELQKENPEAAQAELEKAEKLRIQERMSLKHRNTSKWAKNIITKGINDAQARQALSEQLRISRQLTETKTMESDSDENETTKAEDKSEIPENFRNFGLIGDSSENPWLLSDGKEKYDENEEAREHGHKEERLRKLKPVTAEETEERQDEDGEESENSDQDEKFELMDESEAKEIGRKERKIRKKKKKMQDKKERSADEEKKVKRKLKEKKKKTVSKGNTEEETDVEKETRGNEVEDDEEGKKRRIKKKKAGSRGSTCELNDVQETIPPKKKKRKITAETPVKEKSKRSKKAKFAKSPIEEDRTEHEGICGHDNERLLIEGVEIDDQETSQFTELNSEVVDSAETMSDGKTSLNPKNVFQIEDLGGENDLSNYARDDSDDDIKAQRMTIIEAFANDDVIEEFVKEKDDASEASKPKDLDLSLPGWGDWGGPGIDEIKRKKKFVVPAKPAAPRKDSKLAHVIINEKRDKKFAKNQVSQLPFPFTSREQWEGSVRVPLGKDWNTTSVHQKLIKPRIVTLPGTIIEPIKSANGVRRSGVVEDGKRLRHPGKNGVKTMGSGIEIHS